MGSLVVKIDDDTKKKISGKTFYSDIDMLNYRSSAYDDELPIVFDVEAVKVAVRNILMWRVGESVISPEFGHNLKLSMYAQMTEFNKDQVCEEIKRAIEDNEPRAKIISVSAKRHEEDDENPNALSVSVVYRVVGEDPSDGTTITERAEITGR